MKIVFALANNVDPGEIPRCHLGLHLLTKYSLRIQIRGGSRISGKGVHIYKSVGVRFADFKCNKIP